MRKVGIVFVVLAVMGTLFVGGLWGWAKTAAAAIDLPPLEASGTTVVLAADGKTVIGRIASAEAGKPLSGKDISPLIRHAHLAAEDRGFYKHGAISLTGLGWAMLTNFKSGSLKAGGSGIVQQMARRYAGNNERTIEQKINELPYAYRIDADYSKDEILRHYCNYNYYGRGAYGIADAARTWFGVNAKDLRDLNDPLDVARAAFLAGLVKSPSDYDDYVGKPSTLKYADLVRDRTLYVLDGFRDVDGTGDLPSKEVVEAAKGLVAKDLRPLKLTNTVKSSGDAVTGDPFVMHYMIDWMVAWQTQIAREDGLDEAAAKKEGQIAAETMLARGGYRIRTPIIPEAQSALVKSHKSRLGGGPSGFVLMDPRNGGVIAVSGGRSYKSDPYNYAMYASRPPGSTMKAFVLADAVSKDVSPNSVFAAPGRIQIDGPPITDHGGKDAPGCKMTLADALAVSHNVVAVEALTGRMASCGSSKTTKIDDYPVSPKSVAELIRKAGAEASVVPDRKSPIKIGEEPRLAIGSTLEISPLKLGTMASTLANGGEYIKPYMVSEIDSPTGDSVFEHEEESERVIDEDVADVVNRVLTGVFTKGTARGAQVDKHPLAGKTGTTDEEQGDAWGFAYNAINSDQKRAPAGVCAGWAGKNANRAGADVMKVCQGLFQAWLAGTPTVNFPKADLDKGQKYGLKEAAAPPPPPPTTEPQPEPSTSSPKPPTTEPTAESPATTPTSEPRPDDPPPATTQPRRLLPTVENGGGINIGNIPIPGLPG